MPSITKRNSILNNCYFKSIHASTVCLGGKDEYVTKCCEKSEMQWKIF